MDSRDIYLVGLSRIGFFPLTMMILHASVSSWRRNFTYLRHVVADSCNVGSPSVLSATSTDASPACGALCFEILPFSAALVFLSQEARNAPEFDLLDGASDAKSARAL